MQLGHFDKHFVQNTKKGLHGKILDFFLPDTVENYISNKKFNPTMDTIRSLFPNSGHLFRFSKSGRGDAPPHPTSFMLF